MKTYVQFLRRLLVHKIFVLYGYVGYARAGIVSPVLEKYRLCIFIHNVDIAVYSLANSHVICADNWL